MGKVADQPRREAAAGEEAERIKRELLGIGSRRKHHDRKATRLQAHATAPDARHRTYRYRVYPTEEQAEQLERTFGACRWVYNEALALRSDAWEQHRVNVRFAELCRALTGWKRIAETAWLKEVSSTVLQQSLRHLDHAFSRFFKGETKYPKRKKKGRSLDTAVYVRTGFRWAEDPGRRGTGSITLATSRCRWTSAGRGRCLPGWFRSGYR